MLRVAVPNKGALSDAAALMLAEAGYRQRRNSKDLVTVDAENDVEFFYLRPRDIAIYVGEGTLDVGVTGRDLLLDSGAHADEVMTLGFAASTFRFAAPEGGLGSVAELQGRRIATSYPGIVRAHLAAHGVEADVVETGTTLRQAGLAVFGDPILSSEAVVITRTGSTEPAGFDVFRRRLESVIVARTYVMMDYDISTEHLDRAVELTPGIESPTVSPLRRDGWVAVRSMVPRDGAQRIMDELYALGGRGILVTDILACRI